MVDTDANKHPDAFMNAPLEEAAGRLVDIMRETQPQVVVTYDEEGGYGHPDHVQVHRVGHRAAELAGTPVVLEATVDRTALARVLSLVHWTRLVPPDFSPHRLRNSYSDRAAITHRIDVRRYTGQKRRSMAAHASQATGGSGPRTLAFFLKLPNALYRRVFATEWFIERGRPPGGAPVADVFASLRGGSPTRA
jgi:LmbE family N-acetylglucosaminyl deacetylase